MVNHSFVLPGIDIRRSSALGSLIVSCTPYIAVSVSESNFDDLVCAKIWPQREPHLFCRDSMLPRPRPPTLILNPESLDH